MFENGCEWLGRLPTFLRGSAWPGATAPGALERIDLSKSGSAGCRPRIGEDHLAGLRLGETKLAGHLIDAARLGKLGFAQAQLAILLAQLVEDLLFGLDVIAALNGVKVLQAINHDEREEHGHGGGEDAHLAHADRVRGLDETGVVKMLREKILRHAHAAAELHLLRHHHAACARRSSTSPSILTIRGW